MADNIKIFSPKPKKEGVFFNSPSKLSKSWNNTNNNAQGNNQDNMTDFDLRKSHNTNVNFLGFDSQEKEEEIDFAKGIQEEMEKISIQSELYGILKYEYKKTSSNSIQNFENEFLSTENDSRRSSNILEDN